MYGMWTISYWQDLTMKQRDNGQNILYCATDDQLSKESM